MPSHGKSFLERFINERIIKPRMPFIIQELVDDDILSVHSRSTNYKSNEYTTYSSAVSAINDMYTGTAEYGALLTGSIIDVRAAFTIPSGLDVIKTTGEDCYREASFIREFMKYNEFDKHIPQEWAKEAEIEGKVCARLMLDKDYEWEIDVSPTKKQKMRGMIKVLYVPWSTYGYDVMTGSDYMDYKQVKYTIPNSATKDPGKIVTLNQDEFVYRRFGGRINKPNHPAMKIWKCLSQIENLDRAMRDWREINNLFAAPILSLKCETAKEVTDSLEQLSNFNFRIRKVFAHRGDFSYISPNMAGVDSLKEEIITNAKIISGTTGVPVHFLGLPDLMSNRSTAENLMELVWASTVKEREIWNSAYNEIINKAIGVYNDKLMNGKTPLRQELVNIEIQNVTKEQWEYLEKVYMPLYDAGAITLDYLLMQIPGLDIEEEKERRANEEESELEKLKTEMEKKELEMRDLQNNEENQNGNNFNQQQPAVGKGGFPGTQRTGGSGKTGGAEKD